MGIIPQKIRDAAWFQRGLRMSQFLSSVISLGCFTSRLVKIIRLEHQASVSNGAVEGILCAAVAYTLITMLVQFITKHGGGLLLRWIQVLMDLLFMGAFIAVAYLTRPHGGSSGPCSGTYRKLIPKGSNCSLPWATFILAIVSTVLHLLTALWLSVQHHRKAQHTEKGNGTDSDYMSDRSTSGHNNGMPNDNNGMTNNNSSRMFDNGERGNARPQGVV